MRGMAGIHAGRLTFSGWVVAITLVMQGCAMGAREAPLAATILPQPVTREAQASPTTEAPSPEPSGQTLASIDIHHQWLYGVPCSPPCWQGITPGVTPASEAIKLLEDNPDIGDIEIYDQAEPPQGTVYWRKGFVRFHGEPALVYEIGVGQQRRYRLQDIIDIYGQPSHVYALGVEDHSGGSWYRLEIVFVDRGFALAQDVYYPGETPDFDEDWRNFYVTFFEPGLEAYAEAWGNPTHADELIPWKGMLGFDAYCQGTACPGERGVTPTEP